MNRFYTLALLNGIMLCSHANTSASDIRAQRDALLRSIAPNAFSAVISAEKALAQAERAVGIARRRAEQKKLMNQLCRSGESCTNIFAEKQYQQYDYEITYLRTSHSDRLAPLETTLNQAVAQLIAQITHSADQAMIAQFNRELTQQARTGNCPCIRAGQPPVLDTLFLSE